MGTLTKAFWPALLLFFSLGIAEEHITYSPPTFDPGLSTEEWAQWNYADRCPKPAAVKAEPCVLLHANRRVGGTVDLKGLQNFMNSAYSIAGAFYQNDSIFLVGRKGKAPACTGFMVEDFLVAIRALDEREGRGPTCTMAPPENEQDRFRYTRVLYSAGVEHTHLGQLLFETDRVFKCLSLGYDNITHDSLIIAGGFYRTKLDFREYSLRPQSEQWQTLVMTPRDMKIFSDRQGGVLEFHSDNFMLTPENVRIDHGRYLGQRNEGAGADLARHFNQYLFEYAKQFPVLKETMRMAKLVAVLKWLRDSGMRLQIDTTSFDLYGRYTPEKTPVLMVKREKVVQKPAVGGRTLIESMYIGTVGGIDLTEFRFKPKRLEKVKRKFLKKEEFGIFCLFYPARPK